MEAHNQILMLQKNVFQYSTLSFYDWLLEFLRIRKVLRIHSFDKLEFENPISKNSLRIVLSNLKQDRQLIFHYPYYGIGYRAEYMETQLLLIQKGEGASFLVCDFGGDNIWYSINQTNLVELVSVKLQKEGKYYVEIMQGAARAYAGKEM